MNKSIIVPKERRSSVVLRLPPSGTKRTKRRRGRVPPVGRVSSSLLQLLEVK